MTMVYHWQKMISGRAHRHNLFGYADRRACWCSGGLLDRLLALSAKLALVWNIWYGEFCAKALDV